MRQASDEFKILLHNKNRRLLYWAEIRLLDGTILNLTIDDLMQGDGFKVDDATSGTGSFDIGSVIINKLTLKLNNAEDTFSFYDFNGAEVVAYVGMELSNGTLEKIRMGVYTVDEAKSIGITIILSCLDNIRKLDKPYSISPLKYPATLKEILADVCACCGLVLLTQTFEGDEYVVDSRPNDEAVTFREVVHWVAQISCKYVRCDALGRLFLSWYGDRSSVLLLQDGGYFDSDKPYSSGVGIDGGTFNPWSNGTAVDSGTFDNMDAYHHLWQLGSLSIGTDDIELTGVSVTLEDEEGEENTYLYGKTGYVLNIEKNGLIQDGNHASIAATIVGKKIVGVTIRTFEAGHISDPLIEAGDTVYVTDRKQNSYLTYITNTTFNAGAMQKSSCSAETPAKNGSTRFTNATKAIIESKKAAAKQITEYDKAVQVLTSLITQSFGVFKTAEKQDNGSFIYYMHDMPTLKESKTVWKMTADAFAVSRDGGKTWNAGMDSSGNAVVNVLSAIGINCDWIHSGTLTLGGVNNKNGVLKIVDEKGNLVGEWGEDGVVILRGDVSGTGIVLGGASGKNGYIRILDNAGNEIGRWDTNGLNAMKGAIKGAAITLGGAEGNGGYLVLKDTSGNEIGRWDENGLDSRKGMIKGASITLGGENNSNGILNILDTKGGVLVRLDKDGVFSEGKYTCGNDKYGRYVEISEGTIKFLNRSGEAIAKLYATSNKWLQLDVGDKVGMRFLEDSIYLDSPIIGPDGFPGKSGRAEFSDGTYLEFTKGFCTGGNTKAGGF